MGQRDHLGFSSPSQSIDDSNYKCDGAPEQRYDNYIRNGWYHTQITYSDDENREIIFYFWVFAAKL